MWTASRTKTPSSFSKYVIRSGVDSTSHNNTAKALRNVCSGIVWVPLRSTTPSSLYLGYARVWYGQRAALANNFGLQANNMQNTKYTIECGVDSTSHDDTVNLSTKSMVNSGADSMSHHNTVSNVF